MNLRLCSRATARVAPTLYDLSQVALYFVNMVGATLAVALLKFVPLTVL